MNCPSSHSGCWYCQTDFMSPLGWLESLEFDTVMHVECVEYEHNECRGAGYAKGGNSELDLILKELDYMDIETFNIYDSFTEYMQLERGLFENS